MTELLETGCRVLAIMGIVCFGWSVSSSLQQIAHELRRLRLQRDGEPVDVGSPIAERGPSNFI